MDAHAVSLLTNIGLAAFLGLSAYVILLAGEISFGQQAFFGIGAYAAGMTTAMAGWPLWAGLLAGIAAGAAAGLALGLPTLRLRGLYFAIATLAFAEMTRLAFELFRLQVERDGERVGPNGVEGFGGIRAAFDAEIGAERFLVLVWILLALVLTAFAVAERSAAGRALRKVGEDAILAAHLGIDPVRVKLAAATAAGALAGLGGGLYAHFTTYVEPSVFELMLGIHALAYGLIGGLGTAFGPLVGAAFDIGVLASLQVIAPYRMIVFGGLVALLLIVRPRGLLDEATLARAPRLEAFARLRRG